MRALVCQPSSIMNLPEESECADSVHDDVSVNPDNEPIQEDKLVDASLALDTEPVDDNESVNAASDETVPKFVTVIIYEHAANESVDVSAYKSIFQSLANLGSREASVAKETAVDKSRQPTDQR
jgi:hypothetical protein